LLVEDSMPVSVFFNIQSMLSHHIQFERLSHVTSKLRIVKNEYEIACLQRAAEIVDRVFSKIVDEGLEGRSEKELSARLQYLIKSYGADDVAFEPIVASGPNGANPHHTPGDRVIQKGDMVILDFGAKYKGYCSDITRTVAIGDVSDEAKLVYQVVKESQEVGLKSIRAGIKTGDIDLSVRNNIAAHGFGNLFIHRTGHGLGLDIHEEPYIAPNGESIIEDGMIFTVEPGIYLPGKFGVRIEDDVVVMESAGRSLTSSEKELIYL
ncbi:M24 family metallopeptidase, partial [Desulfofundulus sp.]|uniref:M24 family metallopeptidase n=1 Tax=Desulfofundulus sp. TaxID=2282750 RepID=UPI003C796E74